MNNSTLERDIDLEATTILSIIRFDSIDRQFDYVCEKKKRIKEKKKKTERGWTNLQANGSKR